MLKQLLEAHSLSQAMLVCAQQQNWQQIEQQQTARNLLLNQAQLLTTELKDETESLRAEDLIEQIQALDEQLLLLCQNEQKQTLGAMKTSQKGSKMQAAYKGT